MGDRRPYEEVIAEREKNAHKPKPYEPGHENHLEKVVPAPRVSERLRGMRIFLVLLAVVLLSYAVYGVLIDDLVLPVKRASAKHLHGAGALTAALGLVLAAASLIAYARDLRTFPEARFRLFIRVTAVAAFACLIASSFVS